MSLYYARREGKGSREAAVSVGKLGRRVDLGAPGEPLPHELVSLLPAGGARLALVPPGADAAAELLVARGFTTAPLAAQPAMTGAPAAPTEAGWDAVVVLAGPAGAPPDFPPLLASLRAVLAERGQLLIVGTFAATVADGVIDSRALVVALSEAGFVVLRQQPLGTESGRPWRELLTARRDAFRVREYRPGDEVQILPIFQGSFFVERSVERWSWEYRENPYDNLKVSEAFADDGQLVAHYAGFPVRFRLAGRDEPVTALHIGDTMTLPGVRHVGRGATSLLGRTVRHFYARFCEGRVAFNYGFNTGNIQRFSLAFVGARRLEDVPFHLLPLPASRPLAGAAGSWRRRIVDRLAGWHCATIDRFDASFDELLARTGPDYEMLVERDARYLDWRYRRQPGNAYRVYACHCRRRLVGWGVFRRRQDALVWGDALFDRRFPGAVSRVLSYALDQPEHAGITAVETWASARPAWWRPLLRSIGFADRADPDGLGLVFVPFTMDPAEDMQAGLYYTMGDSDLF